MDPKVDLDRLGALQATPAGVGCVESSWSHSFEPGHILSKHQITNHMYLLFSDSFFLCAFIYLFFILFSQSTLVDHYQLPPKYVKRLFYVQNF